MSQTLQLLSDDELNTALRELPGWARVSGKLHKEFVFRDFVEAFGFMTMAAMVSEREDHHPEWFNVYERVRVDLTTHESGGITTRDVRLAAAMNRLAGH